MPSPAAFAIGFLVGMLFTVGVLLFISRAVEEADPDD